MGNPTRSPVVSVATPTPEHQVACVPGLDYHRKSGFDCTAVAVKTDETKPCLGLPDGPADDQKIVPFFS